MLVIVSWTSEAIQIEKNLSQQRHISEWYELKCTTQIFRQKASTDSGKMHKYEQTTTTTQKKGVSYRQT